MSESPTPFELTSLDRYRIAQAREALAAAEQADGEATAHAFGRLEVAVKHLLAVFDEHQGGESRD